MERTPLTREQVKEAIEQMKSHCDEMMASYTSVTARGTLYILGYHGEDCEQVLTALHENGFSYCLDHEYKCSNGIPNDGRMEYPPMSACYWGPDQMKSRLQSVHLPLNR